MNAPRRHGEHGEKPNRMATKRHRNHKVRGASCSQPRELEVPVTLRLFVANQIESVLRDLRVSVVNQNQQFFFPRSLHFLLLINKTMHNNNPTPNNTPAGLPQKRGGGKEGIWYLARGIKGWGLYTHVFNPDSKVLYHNVFWEKLLAPRLARHYKLTRQAAAELALCPYAFPRGRVTKIGAELRVYHGSDWMPFITKDAIESAFNIKGKARWFEDEHERCITHDKDAVRKLLQIADDWKAVE